MLLVSVGLIPAYAQPIADFYRGKTEAEVGAAAGGYDIAARTLANHMSRHIPGNFADLQHAGRPA
jgi:hypothetical protein